MNIQIAKIDYILTIQDLYTDSESERTIKLSGYKVEYYLNKYIESTISIPTEKELSIEQIKEKIINTYRGETKC